MLRGEGGWLSCAKQKLYGISFTMATTKEQCSPGSVGISWPCALIGCLISLFPSHTTWPNPRPNLAPASFTLHRFCWRKGLGVKQAEKDLPLMLDWCSPSVLSDRHKLYPLELKRFNLVAASFAWMHLSGSEKFIVFCGSLFINQRRDASDKCVKTTTKWAYLF